VPNQGGKVSEITGSAIVTGNIVGQNEDWQTRAKVLCSPDLWQVAANPSKDLFNGLTEVEIQRLEPKIQMVLRVSKFMLAGMVKGTIKYPTDQYSLETWMAHLLGEGADYLNYITLTLSSFNNGGTDK
jgi:hypothetical protein